MAEFTADFEAGTNGNAITTGAGEASATKFDQIGGSPVYDVAHVAHGTLAMKSPNADPGRVIWNDQGADHYGRFYLYATANPANNPVVMKAHGDSGGGSGGPGVIKVLSDGKIRLEDSGAAHTLDSTASIAVNQWIRIEYHVVHSTTVGSIEAKLFNDAASTSETETVTSPASWNTGTWTADAEIRFGMQDAFWGADIWLDDVVANAVSYPGPIAGPAVFYTILNGSDEQLVNVNAGGTDIDAATYKDGVELTESELATLLSASFGKKNIAVLPDLSGVADARQIKKTTFSAETESA